MAKKATKKKSNKGRTKGAAAPLKDRAHKVWLAGLGALAVAEAEGSKLFNQLVERGTDLEKRGKPVVDKLVKKAGHAVTDARKEAHSRVGKVGDEAKASWSKVESLVDDKVTSTLHRLGIPTRKEIEELTRRVTVLTEKLEGTSPAKRGTRKAAKKSARKPAKKATRKPAKKAAKKAARKPAKKASGA